MIDGLEDHDDYQIYKTDGSIQKEIENCAYYSDIKLLFSYLLRGQ